MKIVIILLLMSCQMSLNAQTRYGLLAGSGVSFLTGKAGGDQYSASYALLGQFLIRKKVSERVWIESGLGYQLRQFSRTSITFSDSVSELRSTEERRYPYLVIPLQVSYKTFERGAHQLTAGLGMSYGFIMSPKADVTDYYRSRGFTSTHSYPGSRLPAGLVQSDSKPISVYSFLASVQLHATWYWRDHYALRAFYDYALYDVNAVPRNGSRMHLNLAGLMLGYVF